MNYHIQQADYKLVREIAIKYNTTLRSLRFYEERGLLRPRRVGVTRQYRPEDEAILQIIITGRRLQFSLAEIARLILSKKTKLPSNISSDVFELGLSSEEIQQKIKILECKRNGIELAINELNASLEKVSPRQRKRGNTTA